MSRSRSANARSIGLPEVAQEAGVSVVTVSRALNNPQVVSARTREAIHAAMRQLNYVPNLAARSLVSRRSGLVAAFVPTLNDSVFADTVQGLSESLTAAGLHLAIGDTSYSPSREEELVLAMLGRRPDALVLTGTVRTPHLAAALRQAGIPVIETWHLGDSPQIDMRVGFSNHAAAQAVARHLIDRGYRRFAYVGRPTDGNDRAQARRAGFLDAVGDRGLVIDPDRMIEIETSMSAGAAVVRSLLALPAPPDAVLFSGDNSAAGALLACLSDRIRVPQDLAIAGFGDLEIARIVPGGLTTVAFRSRQIGAEAGRLIRERLAGGVPVSDTIDVGFELVSRGST